MFFLCAKYVCVILRFQIYIYTKLIQNSVVFKVHLEFYVLQSFENNHAIPCNINIVTFLVANQFSVADAYHINCVFRTKDLIVVQ